MFFRNRAPLKGAEDVLTGRGRILAAIQNEETALLGLVRARRDAEIALTEAEATAALGERSDVAGAGRRLEEARSAIERQSTRLAGLRGRAVKQAVELSEQRNALKREIVAHADELRAAFVAEWKQAVSVLSALMGKRQALETLIGRKVEDLPEPKATAAELSEDATIPYRLMESLEGAIAELAFWRNQADAGEMDILPPGVVRKPYDPSKVYFLIVPFGGLEAGTLVVDASFAPGILNRIVARGEATPADVEQWREDLLPAQKATAGFAQEQREAMEHEFADRVKRDFDSMTERTWARGNQAQPPERFDSKGARYFGPVTDSVG